MKEYRFRAVVIGSGAAGFNCADRLFEYGCTDIAVVTESVNAGTSRNTGSDKQTYYKLSLAGDEGDSVYSMAKTLFDGGAVDGDIAFCEAANSVASFVKLANLGVAFPTNEYGEYVGYKTDHDPYRRATSIGPYTSKKMTEALEKAVVDKGIPIIDNCQIVKILTCDGNVVGLLGIDAETLDYVAIRTPHVVLATGGPASVYFDSVYPMSHTGNSSLAWEAGAAFVNLSEWQYGLASTDFRWNVSGTYQQVLPRYISVDERGEEREFLTEIMSPPEMLKNIFLKGYEWPFDVRKVRNSSLVDLAVYRETALRGRKVYLDFTRNPSGLENGWQTLDPTAYEYLKNSDALLSTPIERLQKMNAGAVELYRDHGIDLERRPLRIAVCAQHCNGGVCVDSDWQTSVQGLYACGEVAGTFGVFRPGGSALNSGQVGGMRAARHIAYHSQNEPSKWFDEALADAVAACDAFVAASKGERSTLAAVREGYQKAMSERFAFLRDRQKMRGSLAALETRLRDFSADNVWADASEIPQLFKNRDIIVMQTVTAHSIVDTAERFGARGSAFVYDGGDFLTCAPVKEVEAGRETLLLFRKRGETIECRERGVHPLPKRDLWFERVWNRFNKERGIRNED